jgi:5-methylcytosine-specific restriction endonuclease McrA
MSVDPRSEVGKIIRRMKRLKGSACKDFFVKWGKLRKELYKTAAYQNFLLEVRTRCMFRCQKCNKPGRHVHHKVRVYDNPELVVDPSNGVYLCVACHRAEHKHECKTTAAPKGPVERGAQSRTKPSKSPRREQSATPTRASKPQLGNHT